MSSATALVRFPDGSTRWAIYHGTSDVLRPRLFDSAAEAWAQEGSDLDGGADEPVAIYSDYGGGFWWEGYANQYRVGARSCVPYGSESFDGSVLVAASTIHDGMPIWAVPLYGSKPL